MAAQVDTLVDTHVNTNVETHDHTHIFCTLACLKIERSKAEEMTELKIQLERSKAEEMAELKIQIDALKMGNELYRTKVFDIGYDRILVIVTDMFRAQRSIRSTVACPKSAFA